MRLILALTLVAAPALANDGFGGLTATGLTFGKTEAIAMDSEDLFLSPTQVRVDYVFRNLTDRDVTGEIIFPLPPISLADQQYSAFNLPEDRGRDNLVNFTVRADGAAIPVGIDRIAVLEPEDKWDRPPVATYDTPGQDVTELVTAAGLPLTVDSDAVIADLTARPLDELKALEAQGLVGLWDDGNGGLEILPLWSIVLRYHWTQTFPAGQVVKIGHAYDNYPSGGLFTWADPPEDYHRDLQQKYCIDSGTSKAIVKAIKQPGTDGDYGSAFDIAYVLRTANSWAAPIGHFSLTLDKGDVKNVISLCADGVTKTGPTTFVVEKDNYTPDRDLDILVVTPLEPY